jgi:ABC-type dipeptide/oligopeptide/nickel transport system ATPase component
MTGLAVRDLHVTLAGSEGPVPAVKRVSFDVAPGTCLGIVGESGSGKTVSSLAVMGLLPRGASVRGSATLDGEELIGLSEARLRAMRGRDIGMVFQDPMSSFNPVRRIGSLIVESIKRHQSAGAGEARAKAVAALRAAGVPQPEARIDAYPHQLSGGLRQRAMIALATCNAPKLLIADEPTTALDATIQLQVLALLKERREGLSTILITHNLAVTAELCQTILVMRRGEAVECGPAAEILSRPKADYTKSLLDAVPRFAEATHD